MSDLLQHECGIALLRLKKPLQYYIDHYGTAFYGLNKMYLLMEKQRNRGQDGVGLANVKLSVPPGHRYLSRSRSVANQPIEDLFSQVMGRFADTQEHQPERLKDAEWLQKEFAFTGEVFLGHLRYGTYGRNTIERVHPFLRQNNWRSRTLALAGNFNLTNVDELFDILVGLGQHPKEKADTVTVLEKVGHFLDEEVENRFRDFKSKGHENQEISDLIAQNLDVANVLEQASEAWDGGYVMGGIIGSGDAFIARDPNGIRPCFWYEDDEVVVAASERPVIQTAFNTTTAEVKELLPGEALLIGQDGSTELKQIRKAGKPSPCSFERIYFSRGNDADIYQERMALGESLVPKVLEAIEHDIDSTVFSFIPNTAETSFYGLVKGMESHLNQSKIERIIGLGTSPDPVEVKSILEERPRVDKVALKDAKLRTFIADDGARDDLVAHAYDITYGTVERGQDQLVVIDDSIVRGTTLKRSILRILDRLDPIRIVVVSSAPQIRYPDCYGIDMAKMGDFIAFQAAIAIHKERGNQALIDEVYADCKAELEKPYDQQENKVKPIYQSLTPEETSAKISELLTPEGMKAQVQIIYQSISGLHEAIPHHQGDWYFTGNFPTPGGNRVVNRAFVFWKEGRSQRAY